MHVVHFNLLDIFFVDVSSPTIIRYGALTDNLQAVKSPMECPHLEDSVCVSALLETSSENLPFQFHCAGNADGKGCVILHHLKKCFWLFIYLIENQIVKGNNRYIDCDGTSGLVLYQSDFVLSIRSVKKVDYCTEKVNFFTEPITLFQKMKKKPLTITDFETNAGRVLWGLKHRYSASLA